MTSLFRLESRRQRWPSASRLRRRLRRSSISSTVRLRRPPTSRAAPRATQASAAGLVVRINRLEEELRQANGRIEELENAQHRLEAQLQKFRQDVEYPARRSLRRRAAGLGRRRGALGARPAGAPPRPRRSDAFDPNADPNAPGAPRPLGTTPPSPPLVRDRRRRWRASSPPPARRSNSAKDRRRPRPRPRADR